MTFTVDRAVLITRRLTPWVTTSFLAEPGRGYDAALSNGKGGCMAKFKITFVRGNRDAETVEADHYSDHPPFVDFEVESEDRASWDVVARFRADDIQQIMRQG